jgi:hypothetical protein
MHRCSSCATRAIPRCASRERRTGRFKRRGDGGHGSAGGAAAAGFAVEWTGQSLQERESAAQAPMLIALSMLVVFLVLAALYESWAIPSR